MEGGVWVLVTVKDGGQVSCGVWCVTLNITNVEYCLCVAVNHNKMVVGSTAPSI